MGLVSLGVWCILCFCVHVKSWILFHIGDKNLPDKQNYKEGKSITVGKKKKKKKNLGRFHGEVEEGGDLC